MANQLSVVIACKNEAANIRGCIESARKVADEILVADSLSTDPTLDIVRQMGGCRIIQREFINFSNFKNWALGHCTHPWALVLDADERLTDELVDEIRGILAGDDPPFDAYRVVSKIFFLGRLIRHSGCGHPTSIRFFRRAVCRFGPESVHESIRVDTSRVGWLRARLLHYTYRSLAQRTEKQNHYTTLAAQDKHEARSASQRIGDFGATAVELSETLLLAGRFSGRDRRPDRLLEFHELHIPEVRQTLGNHPWIGCPGRGARGVEGR